MLILVIHHYLEDLLQILPWNFQWVMYLLKESLPKGHSQKENSLKEKSWCHPTRQMNTSTGQNRLHIKYINIAGVLLWSCSMLILKVFYEPKATEQDGSVWKGSFTEKHLCGNDYFYAEAYLFFFLIIILKAWTSIAQFQQTLIRINNLYDQLVGFLNH